MPDTLIKFKTGDLSKMDNGATDEVSINNGTVYFATDDTTKNGKIYFDSPEGDRIDMTAYAKESDYATLAGNVNGTVSVAHGGTGATDAATARTNLGIPVAGTTATAIGTTANGGSATTWSKSDHVHNITLATGDNNGQVKIAGTNISVKGLGSAAYTESSSYASATNEITHLKDGSAEGSLRATGTVEESSTYTIGEYAIAFGSGTKASGRYSYAEGGGTTASGDSAHAEGSGTTASAAYSHAEGGGTVASGQHAHAEGGGTTASGNSAHAEGSGTTALGAFSHAEGNGTRATYKAQHVFGEYNILDPYVTNYSNRGNYIEIVGKGISDSERSNARTLDWSGNEVLSGKLTVGTDPTNNMDVATKQYVDNAFIVNDAMIFKGVLDSPSEVPATHQAGWTYRIGTTGTYAGKICEVGDLLICTVDGTTASNDHWNVVQNNIDGALFKGTNTFTDEQVLIADGVTGKTKTSGFTIAKSVPSDAKFTDTTYTFDGTYNASTNKAATVSTVTNAINALDGNLNSTTPGAAKTLTAFSQTNGKISATFGNISITKSQISDFPTSMPASDVSSWAKAASKPTYTAAEVGAATDDHTHTIKLASDTGTSTVSLTSGGKFKLTAGGSSVIFTMPSLSSSDVTTALGFTPYNATNPNGYTNNTGTITGVTGSDGLTGSGTSGSVTIKHAAPSTSPATTTSAIYPITIDKYGHITAKGSAVTPLTASSTLDASKLSGTIPASCYTNTIYGAEKGISLSSGKFGHSNTAITAQTTQAVYPIKIDAYGHITGYGSAVTSMPASDVSAWAKATSKPTYTAAEVGALPDDTTIADHSVTTPTGGTSRTTDVTLNTATVLSSVKSAGAVPTLGTAIPADDITAWTTNTPTAVTKKTVVTSASGATAAYANGILTITDGSFSTGDSVSVTAGTAASLSYTAKSIPNVTAVGSMPTFNTTTVATSVKTQPAFSVTTTTTELSHTIS